jgi:hypothetical protein
MVGADAPAFALKTVKAWFSCAACAVFCTVVWKVPDLAAVMGFPDSNVAEPPPAVVVGLIPKVGKQVPVLAVAATVVATVIETGLPVQVAVPLVQVALVGAAVQPEPAAFTTALANAPAVRVTVAVEPVQPLLNPASVTVPVPENPLPPLTPVTDPKPVQFAAGTSTVVVQPEISAMISSKLVGPIAVAEIGPM